MESGCSASAWPPPQGQDVQAEQDTQVWAWLCCTAEALSSTIPFSVWGVSGGAGQASFELGHPKSRVSSWPLTFHLLCGWREEPGVKSLGSESGQNHWRVSRGLLEPQFSHLKKWK